MTRYDDVHLNLCVRRTVDVINQNFIFKFQISYYILVKEITTSTSRSNSFCLITIFVAQLYSKAFSRDFS